MEINEYIPSLRDLLSVISLYYERFLLTSETRSGCTIHTDGFQSLRRISQSDFIPSRVWIYRWLFFSVRKEARSSNDVKLKRVSVSRHTSSCRDTWYTDWRNSLKHLVGQGSPEFFYHILHTPGNIYIFVRHDCWLFKEIATALSCYFFYTYFYLPHAIFSIIFQISPLFLRIIHIMIWCVTV